MTGWQIALGNLLLGVDKLACMVGATFCGFCGRGIPKPRPKQRFCRSSCRRRHLAIFKKGG